MILEKVFSIFKETIGNLEVKYSEIYLQVL